MKKAVTLRGKIYGRLRVIRLAKDRHQNGRMMWKCRCECGNLTTVLGQRLTSGRTTSCGCRQKEAGLANLDVYRKSRTKKPKVIRERKRLFPPTPEPYPNAAAEKFKQYKYMIDRVVKDRTMDGMEEVATDSLLRACYLASIRQIRNEPAYIWAWLKKTRSKLWQIRKRAKIKLEKIQPIGGPMTDSTLHETTVSDAGVNHAVNPPRRPKKFRRC